MLWSIFASEGRERERQCILAYFTPSLAASFAFDSLARTREEERERRREKERESPYVRVYINLRQMLAGFFLLLYFYFNSVYVAAVVSSLRPRAYTLACRAPFGRLSFASTALPIPPLTLPTFSLSLFIHTNSKTYASLCRIGEKEKEREGSMEWPSCLCLLLLVAETDRRQMDCLN